MGHCCSRSAEGDDDRTWPHFSKRARGLFAVRGGNGSTEEVFRFGLVDDQDVDASEARFRTGSFWRRVQNDGRATLLSGVEESVERFRRRFKGGQYHDRSDPFDG